MTKLRLISIAWLSGLALTVPCWGESDAGKAVAAQAEPGADVNADSDADTEAQATTSPAATRPATASRLDSSPVIPVFALTGRLPERPGVSGLSFDLEEPMYLHELIRRLKKAADDPRVPGVALTFDNAEFGWAQMEELRAACRRLRSARKEVYCYLEQADLGSYLVSTAASRVCLSQGGWLDVRGVQVESPYFKGLMDKIGVSADIEHMGDYKAAGEPFTRTGPSPEAEEMLQWLARDLFDQMVEAIAEGRDISVARARELIDQGPFHAQDALKNQLIDEVLDADAFIDVLRQKHGDELRLDHDYAAKERPSVDFSSPLAVFKILGEAMKSSPAKRSHKPAVAVIYLDGAIVTGETPMGLFGESGNVGSTTIRRRLALVRQDSSIKAVVMRVDSPGGSAIASDIIWRAARDLAEVKPLVISMGNVAASGGYYAAVAAPTIFADPATITGSIGVIGGKLVTKGLWDWVGINFHELSYGENADMESTNRPYDDRERALVRGHLQYVYDMFLDRVKRGRSQQLTGDLQKMAGGRVYTGRQALGLGLVDRLGGLHDAVEFAAAKAKLKNYDIRLVPEPTDFFQQLMKSLGPSEEESEDQIRLQVGDRRNQWLSRLPAAREILEVLRKVDPRRAAAVARGLTILETLAEESALCVMTEAWLIR